MPSGTLRISISLLAIIVVAGGSASLAIAQTTAHEKQ
jgi:hypothetical protein